MNISGMDAVSSTVKLIASQHVPLAVEDLGKLTCDAAVCAATELAELARRSQAMVDERLSLGHALDDQHESEALVEHCAQLASACQKAKARGAGWQSPAWQECKIFAHLYAPVQL